MAGAEHPGQQAQAVEHDPRGPGSVDRILDCRFRTGAAALEQPGEGVGRHARHFDRHEQHEQVIRGCHQAHAERRSQHERVEISAVLAVGNSRYPGEQDVEHEKAHQEQPHVGGERVEHDQSGEEFLTAGSQVADRQPPQIAPGIPQRKADTAKRHERRIEMPQHRQDPAQEKQHDRGRQGQFRPKERQRHGDRVVEQVGDERAEIHWSFLRDAPCCQRLPTPSAPRWATAGATGGASWTRRVQSASVSTCRFTVGVT